MMTSMEGFNVLAKEVLPKIINRLAAVESAVQGQCQVQQPVELPSELTELPVKVSQLGVAHGNLLAEIERLSAEFESLRGLCESALAKRKERAPRKRKEIETPVIPAAISEPVATEDIVIPEPIEQELPAPDHDELDLLPASVLDVPAMQGVFMLEEIEQIKAFSKVGLSADLIATQLGKDAKAVDSVLAEWKARGEV